MDIELILKARGNEGSDTQKRYAGWLNKFFPRLESQSKEEVASILLDEKGEEIVRIVPVQKCVQPTLPRINLVTVSENGEFTSSDSFKYVGRVARNKLLLPFSYHSLRHTHATVLIENGVEAKAVQQRLGHRSIITTLQVYVHTTEKMKDKAVNVFEKYARLKPD